jgi:regulatory protein
MTVASSAPAHATGDTVVTGGTRRDPAAHTRRVGDEVAEDVRKALSYVLRSTNARPQTEAEVLAKLRGREVPADVAREALAHARRLGAIDDARLAQAWVEERGVRRGFGRTRLRLELARRQVPEHVLEAALEVLEDRDDLAAATELARGRLRQLPGTLAPEAVARRLTAYLARRGHPPGLAQRVAAEVSGLRERWD